MSEKKKIKLSAPAVIFIFLVIHSFRAGIPDPSRLSQNRFIPLCPRGNCGKIRILGTFGSLNLSPSFPLIVPFYFCDFLVNN